MTATAATTPPAVATPRRKRRFWRKLFVGLIVAAVVVFAVVQGVLWSDYPRQIAINIAQKITGLRVEIGKLTIEWSGHTTIDDLRVSLPLADKPFLTVPHIDAHHTPLPLIVLTVNVAIESVAVDHPVIDVRQDRDKVWNLQQVLAQLTTPSKNAAAGGSVQLPDVKLTDAEAHVTLADGRSLTLDDVDLTGQRGAPLEWNFDGHLGKLASANGSVSASGRWPHRATILVNPALLEAAKPLLGDALKSAGPVLGNDPTVAAQLEWTGARTDTGLAGRLTIPNHSTYAGQITAAGTVDVKFDDGTLRVQPTALTVVDPIAPPLSLEGGTLAYALASSDIHIDDLRARFANGSVRVNGRGNVTAQQGSLAASWEQITFPAGITHQGSVELEAANLWPSKPWVRGNVNLLAGVAGGTLEARSAIRGDGPSWTDATYVFDVPVLKYGKQSQIGVTNASATLHQTADTVELVGVHLASAATLTAHGLYHFAGPASGTGYLTAVGDGFSFGPDQNLGFSTNVWADTGAFTVQHAYAHLGDEAWANLAGTYELGKPEPINMALDFDSDPNLSLAVSHKVTVAGHAKGHFKVGGTLAGQNPLVKLDGSVQSRQFKVSNLLIGDADLGVKGSLVPDRAAVHTDHLSAFGGDGWFGAEFPFFSDTVHAWMGFDHIDAAALGKAVKVEGLSGVASGDLDVHVPLGKPGFDIRTLYGTGRVDVLKPAFAPLVEAEHIFMPVKIGDGYARVQPVADQAKGGRADIDVWADLNQPTKLKVRVGLNQWLTALPNFEEFSALTSGDIGLDPLDLMAKSADGKIDLDEQFFSHNDPVGRSTVELQAEGRQVRLHHVAGDVLGGVVYGTGTLNLDDLTAGQLWAGIEGLSLDRLANIDKRLTGVGGKITAQLHSRAATGENPLGPVQADLDVTADHAEYKGIQIGNSHVTAFLDTHRVALADDPKNPNYLALAGGQARIWGRFDQIPPADADGQDAVARTSAFLTIGLNDLDTEQLNKIVDPDGKPVPGRLNGNLTAFGDPREVRQLSGQGVIKISDANLANIGVLAVLYNAMHANFASTPSGRGQVQFTVNAGRLDVTDLDYFQDGIYARGAISVDNVMQIKTSPISGYVIGTYRPLRDIKLPFFGTVDSILNALQASATTLQVSGDLKHVQAVPASLNAIGGGLRNLLVGQAQAK